MSGGLYFGLAGFAHLFRNEKRKKEQFAFAMISDLFIFGFSKCEGKGAAATAILPIPQADRKFQNI